MPGHAVRLNVALTSGRYAGPNRLSTQERQGLRTAFTES